MTATACGAPAPTESADHPTPNTPVSGAVARIERDPVTAPTNNSCDALLDHFIARALDQVGPWGLQDQMYPWPMEDVMRSADAVDGPEAWAGPVSGTNNQVAGVAETDTVATDGTEIYAISGDAIAVSRIESDGVTFLTTIDLSFYPQAIVLIDDRLVAFGGGDWSNLAVEPLSQPIRPEMHARTTLAEIDITNPANPEIVSELAIDGNLVDGRAVGTKLQLAISSGPVGFEWTTPRGNGLRAESEALAENRRLVRESTLENWLPWFRINAFDGGVTEENTLNAGTFSDCNQIVVPSETDTLSVITLAVFDMDRGLNSWHSAGVVAEATTYYATQDRTYLATTSWQVDRSFREDPARTETTIHAFATDPQPQYLASGSVAGSLLGQFSIDEYQGHLRVASTTEGVGDGALESRVTTMRVEGPRLVPVGLVDGLGKGERIYAVRFMGDLGYVVTFRQTDPLYTIDLSDPAHPVMTGELKIPGYSAYLHPVGQDLLLGVGQDADLSGRTLGSQITLFDVSDPAHPTRVDTIHIDGASSEAEWDHHAFTYFEGLALTPFNSWRNGVSDQGILVVRVETDHLDLMGRLSPPHQTGAGSKVWWPVTPVRRTIVTPGLILGVGDGGISVWDRSSLDPIEFEPTG